MQQGQSCGLFPLPTSPEVCEIKIFHLSSAYQKSKFIHDRRIYVLNLNCWAQILNIGKLD